MSERRISHSAETSAFSLTCQHRWDFQYGFQLAGSSLKAKDTPLQPREGRAWGAMVAAHHTGADMADCLTALGMESLSRKMPSASANSGCSFRRTTTKVSSAWPG